jgi:Fic/DOC family
MLAKKRQIRIVNVTKIASKRQDESVFLVGGLSSAEARKVQRLALAGKLLRIASGVYVRNGEASAVELLVRQHWQRIAGALVPGGVVSHISAMLGKINADHSVVISHPTVFGKKIVLPSLTLVLVRGPGPLPSDLPLGATGLHWAGRTRMLLENIGKSAPSRGGAPAVESFLVTVLNASGEKALNDIRDQAAEIGPLMGLEKELTKLRALIGSLLGTHAQGTLKTKDGRLVAQGTPVDQERMSRFERLTAHLRTTALANIAARHQEGQVRQHWAFVESYFSNYVEGTRFAIEEARDIVMHNSLMPTRPKDSHDILGVFRLAMSTPFRDSPPTAGAAFVEGLERWHLEMLRMRPEVNPGKIKMADNFAGTTQFVGPAFVRGTLAEGSQLALTVPEGLARAIYYAFLVSEVHPFEDGNGRLSRLVMNSELTRVGMSRIIIPTLYHPQYVDCARVLTRGNEPNGFVNSLVKMANWSVQFDYRDLEALIAALKKANALEESPAQYKLLNVDGSTAT